MSGNHDGVFYVGDLIFRTKQLSSSYSPHIIAPSRSGE